MYNVRLECHTVAPGIQTWIQCECMAAADARYEEATRCVRVRQDTCHTCKEEQESTESVE
jgi:hypothetical protein